MSGIGLFFEAFRNTKYEEKMLIEGGMMATEAEIRGTATRNVLKDLLPSYNVAYKKAPYEEFIEIGSNITGIQVGYLLIYKMLHAKTEAERKKYEKELKMLTDSEQNDAIIDMYSASLKLTGGI